MWPAVVLGLLLVVAGLGVGGLAWADHRGAGRLPKGATIAGLPVGELTPAQARARLQARVGDPARRPVRVRFGDESSRLTAAGAGVSVDIDGAVDRALAAGRRGTFLTRGWRRVSGGEVAFSEQPAVTVDRRAVDRFVARIAKRVAEPATDAKLSVDVAKVTTTDGKDGTRLAARTALERRIVRGLKAPDGTRSFAARTARVTPKVTTADLWRAHKTVVTVSHDAKTVRVFDRDGLQKRYHVAVGDPKYPTPFGSFTVQTMQKDPAWNVPDSEWAGDLAGKTIPGGDPKNPLVARWIGFDGSVGFHGTADLASLGRAASHGCVRMAPDDVKDLFTRVDVGTTVLVGA